jgi:hypothetical protein
VLANNSGLIIACPRRLRNRKEDRFNAKAQRCKERKGLMLDVGEYLEVAGIGRVSTQRREGDYVQRKGAKVQSTQRFLCE